MSLQSVSEGPLCSCVCRLSLQDTLYCKTVCHFGVCYIQFHYKNLVLFRMEFSGIRFSNPTGVNICYSNACVNALLASQHLVSLIDPNHDGINTCGICWLFSYYSRVSRLQPNQVHSSEGLKTRIARIANQFIGNRQQDPTEYIEEIGRASCRERV